MATIDGVYTWRLYIQERDGKDQRKTQTLTCDYTCNIRYLARSLLLFLATGGLRPELKIATN